MFLASAPPPENAKPTGDAATAKDAASACAASVCVSVAKTDSPPRSATIVEESTVASTVLETVFLASVTLIAPEPPYDGPAATATDAAFALESI